MSVLCTLTANGAANESEPFIKVKGVSETMQRNREMEGIVKLSVEAKVAASVAAGLARSRTQDA